MSAKLNDETRASCTVLSLMNYAAGGGWGRSGASVLVTVDSTNMDLR